MKCAIETCEKPSRARRLCSMHYARLRLHGDPLFKRAPRRCSVDGCERRHVAKGCCSMHYARRWHAEHPGHKREYTQEYRQRPEVVARRRLYETSERERARRNANKKRLRATNPEWAARARARARARMRAETTAQRIDRLAYHARRRATEFGARGVETCTGAAVHARVALYGYLCAYCSAAFEQLDHVIPLARGGGAFPSNIVPSCRLCNQRKNWRTPAEWREHEARKTRAA